MWVTKIILIYGKISIHRRWMYIECNCFIMRIRIFGSILLILAIVIAIYGYYNNPLLIGLVSVPTTIFTIWKLWFPREKPHIPTELFNNFLTQLKEVRIGIRKFNPVTGRERLEAISDAIDDSMLSKDLKRVLRAEVSFLRGLCSSDLGEHNEALNYFVNAGNLDDSKIEILERRCSSLFHLGQEDQAYKLSTQILSDYEDNPRAWFVKCAFEETFNFDNIPSIVAQNRVFFSIMGNYLQKIKKYDEFEYLSSKQFKMELSIPISLEHSEFSYWFLILFTKYNNELNKYPNDTTLYNSELSKNESLEECREISKFILDSTVHSEAYGINPSFLTIKYIYHHCNYLLTQDRHSILKQAQLIKNEKFQLTHFGFSHVLTGLLQVEATNKVLEFKDHEFVNEMNLYGLIGYAYWHIGQNESASISFLTYIDNLELIDDLECQNIIFGLNVLPSKFFNPEQVLSEIINKSFSNDYNRRFLEIACKKSSLSNSSIYKLVQPLISWYQNLPVYFKSYLCLLLSQLGKYKECNDLIITDLDRESESHFLFIYIQNLYHLKEGHEELIKLLENWRLNFSPNFALTSYEVNIYASLLDYPNLEKVCEFGISNFPEDSNQFLIGLVYSLHKQTGKEKRINELLKEDLLDHNFQWEDAFRLASICFDRGLFDLGLDLIYPIAKAKPDNALIRQAYFAIVTTRVKTIKQYDTVEIDTVLRIEVDNERKLLSINEDTLNSVKIAKELMGVKKGGMIVIKGSSFDSGKKVFVVDILDKYHGLVAEIMEEISSSFKETGYEIKAISWEKDNLESFHKTLIEQFGEEGDVRKYNIEKLFEDYYSGRITFRDLVSGVNPNQPFEIYKSVTSNISKGFLSPPIYFFQEIDFSEINEIVIDLTSLPILAALNISSSDNFKFLVSQYLIDYLRNKIQEIEEIENEPISLGITTKRVEPWFAPEGYKEALLREYKELLGWVEINCQVTYAPEKLDLMLSDPKFHENQTWFNHFGLDSIFLANQSNRLFLTDDLFYYQKFRGINPISLELFGRLYLNADDNERLVSQLIDSNYLGITLSSKILMNCYSENPILESPENKFRKAIKNLPFDYHKDKDMLYQVLEFVREIHLLTLDLGFKRRLSQIVFVEVFKGYPVTPDLASRIKDEVNDRFRLMGRSEMVVLEDITKAMEIANRSR